MWRVSRSGGGDRDGTSPSPPRCSSQWGVASVWQAELAGDLRKGLSPAPPAVGRPLWITVGRGERPIRGVPGSRCSPVGSYRHAVGTAVSKSPCRGSYADQKYPPTRAFFESERRESNPRSQLGKRGEASVNGQRRPIPAGQGLPPTGCGPERTSPSARYPRDALRLPHGPPVSKPLQSPPTAPPPWLGACALGTGRLDGHLAMVT